MRCAPRLDLCALRPVDTRPGPADESAPQCGAVRLLLLPSVLAKHLSQERGAPYGHNPGLRIEPTRRACTRRPPPRPGVSDDSHNLSDQRDTAARLIVVLVTRVRLLLGSLAQVLGVNKFLRQSSHVNRRRLACDYCL